jgi:hypothetical protein
MLWGYFWSLMKGRRAGGAKNIYVCMESKHIIGAKGKQ